MKKIVIGLLMLMSFLLNAQETEFTFTSDKGMTDFIVTTIENKTDDEIYSNTIEWIKINYKTSDEVILSTIDNKFIRFQGSHYGLVKYLRGTLYTFNSRYTIEISIKDGKYKFDLINIEKFTNQYGWQEADCFMIRNKYCYDRKGELKNEYKFHKEIPVYFNNLNLSLKQKILGVEEKW
jgi:hypothetical protein